MDLVGPRYLKGAYRFYSLNQIDSLTHQAQIHPIRSKSAENIFPVIISFWSRYSLPDCLQMDNELSFRGSNKHPRSRALILRFVLAQGVVPLFIPQAEPWRNEIIEKFNDRYDKKFFRIQTFQDFDALVAESLEYEAFHNQYHRYSS